MAASNDENAEARRSAQRVSEQEIYEDARTRRGLAPHFTCPHAQPLVWVKFGDPWHDGTEAEASMQMLAWQWVLAESQVGRCSPAIHVPEIFRTLTDDHGTFFIVMELVRGTVLAKSVYANPMGSLYPVEECYDLIVETIQTLRRMPTPPDYTWTIYARA